MAQSFSSETRAEAIGRLPDTLWDLTVLGGGITGAAVARDAALRGLKVLLVEAHDFASGTSSGSSKLIHGGVRYLENFEFALVRHAIEERELLRKLYAPLVQDLPFVFPTYKHMTPSLWKLNLGLFLYDAFSRFRSPHRHLNASNALESFPLLQTKNLTGACVYTDSFAEDYRLVIELIKSAHRHTATCLNRMEVTAVRSEDGHIALQLKDTWQKREELSIKTKSLFNCSGPFSDSVRAMVNLKPALQLTQGVHFILPKEKLPISTAFVLSDPELHRILFAVPWKSITYLGTTDTSIKDPLDAQAQRDDLLYVLKIANRFFSASLRETDVIQSWSGVRPLLRPHKEQTNSAISREHLIEEGPHQVFHILGGKLTSHRLMAEDALKPLQKRWNLPKSSTHTVPLLENSVLPPTNASLKEQVAHSIQYEMALQPLDFLKRRTSLYYEKPSLEVAEEIVNLFTKAHSWIPELREKMLKETVAQYRWDQSWRTDAR